jgi:hypothetical protein
MRKLLLASLIPVLSLLGCGAPVSTSSAAAACIVAGACGALFGTTSACTKLISTVNDPVFGQISGNLLEVTPAQVNCISGAGTDCNKAKACLDNGMTPAPCSGNSSTCMGTSIVKCSGATGMAGNNGQSVFDCSTLGRDYTCVAANGTVGCGTASCGGGSATQCSGNFLQSCVDGIMHQIDCSHFSSTCVTTVGISHCRGSGASCSPQNTGDNPLASIRCEGSTLVTCSDGQEARYDCKNLGLSCLPGYGNAIYDCRAGSECDPANFTATCSGNVLRFCNLGKIDSFNCGGAGFVSCDAQAGTCTKG